jgi:formylmethanofuran dehydrogenase subunit A
MLMDLLAYIADFPADDLQGHLLVREIIQHAKVAGPKLELGRRVRPEPLERRGAKAVGDTE